MLLARGRDPDRARWDVDEPSAMGFTALHWAALKGR